MENSNEVLTEALKRTYGEAARAAARGGVASCAPAPGAGAGDASRCGCGSSGCGCGPTPAEAVASHLYSGEEAAALPETAVLASLGCGNPTALADLAPGETVLDLGSGGGIDVLLSARRVGPDGFAYGLDMTEEMLDLARRNQREAGVENVEFLHGTIEDIPLPDASVDVITSNCVINLSADKRRVLAEAFRVLRPGGRFAVSDIVATGEIDERIRDDMELWTGCIAGALEQGEYVRLLSEAGFESIGIDPASTPAESAPSSAADGAGAGRGPVAAPPAGTFVSAFVRARKPA